MIFKTFYFNSTEKFYSYQSFQKIVKFNIIFLHLNAACMFEIPRAVDLN